MALKHSLNPIGTLAVMARGQITMRKLILTTT